MTGVKLSVCIPYKARLDNLAIALEALAPGSYLVLTHICQELLPDKAAAARAKDVYQKAGQPIKARTAAEIRGFFGDFELVEPGLVPKHAWRPPDGQAAADPSDISLGGVARKNA